jgi:ABC-type branched-subunit amino acid transport system ATPase component/ABC-type branched-subunit amino acid transport system permease subunit
VSWITPQLTANGIVAGLVIGLLAMGIVLVYRATGVINFAVGNIGVIGATLLAVLVVRYDVPFWVALPLALVAGVAVAGIAELAVIRRLFRAPRVIVLVATIGLAQLALAVSTALPSLNDYSTPYPVVTTATVRLFGISLSGAQLSIIVTVPIVAFALAWFLNRTTVGKTVQASADNPDLAALSGISPKNVSTLTWVIAGLIGTLALVLVAGQGQQASLVTQLGPDTLARALVAAVIAGLASFPRAMVAGIAIGVAQALIEFNFLNQPGLTDLLLLVAVLVAVWMQSQRRTSDAGAAYATTPRSQPLPAHVGALTWVRNLDRIGIAALILGAVFLPLVVTEPSKNLLYATILAYAICASSLTVLTGWSGLLSLGQMAFAGIGALFAAQLTLGLHLNVSVRNTQLINWSMHPLPFWASVLVAAAVGALLAVIVGLGALRVRGVLLAVTTFTFALAAQNELYQLPVLSGAGSGTVPFTRGRLLGLNVSSQRTYYYVVLVVLVLVMLMLRRLRRSGVGRTMIGVRDNPDAAAGYTVASAATRLKAFALAGAIAGLGGAVLAGAVESILYQQQYFTVNDSLVLVSIVVIGGMGSVGGALLGSLWVIGLPAFFPGNQLAPLLSSSIGLLVMLLYFPGGFAQIGVRLRQHIVVWAERRHPPSDVKHATVLAAAVTPARAATTAAADSGPALDARGLRVQFGGNVAVDDASIGVGCSEIVALIGTNGAGKTTIMNAVGGYLPAIGTVTLLGRDVSRVSAAGRAQLGLGRTFQSAALFPELTVHETVELALEARGHTGVVATGLCLPGARRKTRAQRADAAALVDFLGLGRYSGHYIADLSTGTRRIVELAGLLALGARVLCLDEPTAGVAQKETEAFAPLIVEIRRELKASVLLVEHDMPLVMGISDRIYCLEAGAVIAEGTPGEVRDDPLVIASYLGTDSRLFESEDPAEHDSVTGAPEVADTVSVEGAPLHSVDRTGSL